MIYDGLGEYLTDLCKRNCFAEICVDSTLNLKIIHWDLRYNAYQHPCNLIVKTFWTTKMQQRDKFLQITWMFHNFCSKESSICRNNIPFNNFFFLTHWTHGNKVRWNIDNNANILTEENAFENVLCKRRPFCFGHISVIMFRISSEIRTKMCLSLMMTQE